MKNIRTLGIVLGITLIFTGAGCVSLGGNQSAPTTSGPAGFFLSTDQGENWQPISVMPTASGVKSLSNTTAFGIVEDPTDPKAFYWLTPSNGLFYTYDNGSTWRQSVEPLSSGAVYSITVNPKDNCTLFATNGRQVFRSIDCLRSWTEMFREGQTSRSIKSVAYNPFPPYEIYVLENNGDLLKSEDAGVSWQSAHRFQKSTARIAFDAHKQGLIFVTSLEEGLLRSRDGGATWVSLKDKLKAYPGALKYRRLHIYPTEAEHIYWISKFGILVSRNGGEDWDAVNLLSPPGSASIYSFAVNPKNEKEMYYTSTVGIRSTFYRTLDGGKNWVTRKLPSGQIPTVLRVHPDHPTWLYLGFTIPPKQ